MNERPTREQITVTTVGTALFALAHFITLERLSSDVTQAIVGIMLVIATTYIATKKPSWLFPLLIASIPFEVLSFTTQSSPLHLRPYQLLAVLTLIDILKTKNKREQVRDILQKNSFIIIALATLWIIHILGARTTSIEVIAKYAIIFGIYISIFVATLYHLQQTVSARAAIKMLLISAMAPISIGILQSTSNIHGWHLTQGEWFGRPYGTFVESTWIGMFLGSLCAWSVLRAIQTEHWRWLHSIWFIGFFTIIIAGIARSSWIACAIGITASVIATRVVQNKTPWKQLVTRTAGLALTIIIAGGIVVFTPLTEFNLTSRLLSTINIRPSFESTFNNKEEEITTEEISIKSRFQAIKENIELFKEHPAVGTGFGSVEERRNINDNESSLPFQILVSTGVVGTAVFGLALLQILWNLLRAFRKELLVATTTVAFLVLLFMNLIDAGLLVAFFWIELAIIVHISKNIFTATQETEIIEQPSNTYAENMENQPTFLEEQIHELPADDYRIYAINTYALKKLPPTGTVLDFGAGAGHLVDEICTTCSEGEVDAIDISHVLLDFMHERFKDTDRVNVINGEEEPLQEKRYDRIYTLDVLEHVEDDRQYMKDLHTALRPGGKIFINVPAHQELFSEFDENLGHYRRYSKQELREKLEQAGFVVEDIGYWNTLGYAIVKLSQTYSWLSRPTSVRRRTTTSQEFLNTVLKWWFQVVENNIRSPKGLSLTATVSRRQE